MLTLVQGPMDDVVGLTEAKLRLRIDTTADDDVVTALIAAATSMLDGADGLLGRALMSQSWRYDVAGFPSDPYGAIRLPLPPYIAVNGIRYRDSTGTLQTLASTVWRVIESDRAAYVTLDTDQTWPTTEDGAPDAVQITYQCGYQDLTSPANNPVPQPIRQAILLIAQMLYDTPGQTDIPVAVWSLIAPYRVDRFGGANA